MFSLFPRRLAAALTSLLLIAELLSQPVSAAPALNCLTAFSVNVCVTSSLRGITFKFQTPRSITRVGNYAVWKVWSEEPVAQDGSLKLRPGTTTVLVPINKLGIYRCAEGVYSPNPGPGTSNYVYLLAPQAGPSSLKVTTTALPSSTLGAAYSFRFTATGGSLPYRWLPLSPVPTGLVLIRSGPEAGTMSGKTSLRGFGIWMWWCSTKSDIRPYNALIVGSIVVTT